MVPARNCTGALAESLEAKHLATDRADEFFADTVTGSAEQSAENFCGSLGRDCSCHVSYSTPKMCRPRKGRNRNNIPFALLGVVSLDAERHQSLADAFVLLYFPRPV